MDLKDKATSELLDDIHAAWQRAFTGELQVDGDDADTVAIWLDAWGELHARLAASLTIEQYGRCVGCGTELSMQSSGVRVAYLVDTCATDGVRSIGHLDDGAPHLVREHTYNVDDPEEHGREILRRLAERSAWGTLTWRHGEGVALPFEECSRYAVLAELPYPGVQAAQVLNYNQLVPYEPRDRTVLNGVDVATNYGPKQLVQTVDGGEAEGVLRIEPVLWEHSHVRASHVFVLQGQADEPRLGDLVCAHLGLGEPGQPFETYDGELSLDFERGMVTWAS